MGSRRETIKEDVINMKKTEITFDEELKSILKGNYHCGRVWEAWEIGTMTEEDFTPLEEDEDFISEIKQFFKSQTKKDKIKIYKDILAEFINLSDPTKLIEIIQSKINKLKL